MRIVYIFLAGLLLVACGSTKSTLGTLTQQERTAILQTILNAEFGNQEIGVKKWETDLRIFLNNPEQTTLVEEFNRIIQEINALSATVKLKRVFSKSEANYVIFFSDRDTYARFEPGASDFLEGNFGLFWLRWNSDLIIDQGSMYVDVERTQDIACQKHILREELTQSLGMMNDHDGEKNSIFQKQWNCTTTYTDFDKKLIRFFLGKNIKPAMNLDKLVAFLNQ